MRSARSSARSWRIGSTSSMRTQLDTWMEIRSAAAFGMTRARPLRGFNGHTWGGCCELSNVWVDERYRGQGLRAALLRSAEAEAVARGCVQVVLATHSFQAPGFYERLGYERKYVIEGRQKGYADIIYVQ